MRGGQDCAVALPRGQNQPALHKPPHCEVPREDRVPLVPAGQSRGAAEPGGQKEPGGHAKAHSGSAPAAGLNRPAGQGCCVSESEPGEQK